MQAKIDRDEHTPSSQIPSSKGGRSEKSKRTINWVFACLIVPIFSLIPFALCADAATYYVDATNGNDNNNGLSPQAAWQTIDKVNSVNFIPGDHILFKRGEQWVDKLVVSSSGTAANPITFGSYGSGNKPIITVRTELGNGVGRIWTASNNWTNDGGNVWYNGGFVVDMHRVWLNGIENKEAPSKTDIDATTSWWYDRNSDRIYVYATSNPATFYSSMEVSRNANNSYAIDVNSKSYITFNGLDVRGGAWCLYIHAESADCDYIVIDGCDIGLDAGNKGIYVATSSNTYRHDYGIIKNTTVASGLAFAYNHKTGQAYSSDGIFLNGASHWEVHNNTVSDWYHTGITFSGSYNKAYRNTITGTNIIYMRGFETSGSSSYNEIFYNVVDSTTVRNQIAGHHNSIYYNIISNVRNNPNNGVSGTAQAINLADVGNTCHNNKIYNNVIYNTDEPGIRLQQLTSNGSPVENNEVINNIIVNSGNNSDEGLGDIGLAIEHDVDGNVIKNNLVYKSGVTKLINYRGTSKTTADFNGDHGSNGDVISGNIQADPLFVDIASHNFKLSNGSPAIDAGVDVGISKDFIGNTVMQGAGVDLGAYEMDDGDDPWVDIVSPSSDTLIASTTLLLTVQHNQPVGSKLYVYHESALIDSPIVQAEIVTVGPVALNEGLNSLQIEIKGNTSPSAVDTVQVTVDTTAPGMPEQVMAETDSLVGLVRLNWSANTEPDMASYTIYRNTTGVFQTGLADSIAQVLHPGTTHEDSSVVEGTLYFYWLEAVDHLGNKSGVSEPDSVRPIVATVNRPDVGIVLYDDALITPWTDASWGYDALKYDDTSIVYNGSNAIKIDQRAWGALNITTSETMDPYLYESFQFAIHGGTEGVNVRVYARNSTGDTFPYVPYGQVAANNWTIVTIPMIALSPVGHGIDRFYIQDDTGKPLVSYSMDAIQCILINAQQLDASLPQVAITSPVDSSEVTGTITIRANASDDEDIVGVEFLVNGSLITPDTTAMPIARSKGVLSSQTNTESFSTTWNTATVALPNGTHTLSAVAIDVDGNRTTSSAVTVMVASTGLNVEEEPIAVYDDALATDWVDASWGLESVFFTDASTVHTGTRSIKVEQQAWGALGLHSGPWQQPEMIDPSLIDRLQFSINGGNTGMRLRVFARNEHGQEFPNIKYGQIPADQWTSVSIPMTDFSPHGYGIDQIYFQDDTGKTLVTFYMDNIQLIPKDDQNPSITPPPMMVYDDKLSISTIDVSENLTIDFENTSPVYTGLNSVRIEQTSGGMVGLHYIESIDPNFFEVVQFAIHSGTDGIDLAVHVANDQGNAFPTVDLGLMPFNEWTIVRIPVSELSPDGVRFNKIFMQDEIGRSSVTFYLDDIKMLYKYPTAITDGQRDRMPSDFSLSQNSPNPFNPSTSINYEVPQQSHVTLTVYNLLGQEVIRLVDTMQIPGHYEVTWNGRNTRGQDVASGVYIYRLISSAGFRDSSRMTLLK